MQQLSITVKRIATESELAYYLNNVTSSLNLAANPRAQTKQFIDCIRQDLQIDLPIYFAVRDEVLQ